MNPVLIQFIKFCKKDKIDLLTEDVAYINSYLSLVPITESKAILSDYLMEWRIGMSDELNPIKKQGEGRRKANLWLRGKCLEYCKR